MEDKNDIPQELFEAIERYINGTMESSELKDFNDYLKIDDEFKKQVENIKTTILGNDTKPFKKLITTKNTQSRIKLLKSSKTALAIAIIIAIVSIWYFSRSPNQKLYSKYFKPATELPEISVTNNFDFQKAISNYKKGNYNKAIEEWQILNKQKINNDTLNYILGVAKMANKNIGEAIPFLERCVTENSFPLLNSAYYYLGLAYLYEGNIELAKKNLSLSKNDTSKEILLKLSN